MQEMEKEIKEMKTLSSILILGGLALQLVSCDETEEKPIVWGTLQTDASQNVKTIHGLTLGQTNADYTGYCRYENKKFSFALGEDAPPLTDFYYSIEGVDGPPSENPYTDDGELRTDDDKHFETGQIWTTEGAWDLKEDLILDEYCKVVLFAEAGPSDLTPKEFGKKTFQYVVKINCQGGLDFIPNEYDAAAGPDLTGFRLELWFDNCDS